MRLQLLIPSVFGEMTLMDTAKLEGHKVGVRVQTGPDRRWKPE